MNKYLITHDGLTYEVQMSEDRAKELGVHEAAPEKPAEPEKERRKPGPKPKAKTPENKEATPENKGV